ncbi:MAG: tRNA lysidine(34) synthetase TilS [Firmicutes bacterium]|nr:tRNA lysidine(34) synthetase TilS [Bacillota bacterium]
MNLKDAVKKTIEEKELIQPGDRIILGLSGGPDSIALLHVLASLQQDLNFTLYALHVNHKIRGEEADRDMRYCISCCKNLKIPLTVKALDIPAISKELGTSLEETGRIVRQQALKRKAMRVKADNPVGRVRIALAHNKDDQAETVLMRILRGTGVHGLAAMEYERDDGFIRPLLDCPRSDIEEYCKANNLRPKTDSTNLVAEYTRNKIRLRLIPQLEEEYNPNLKDGLVRLAESAREDDSFIDDLAKRELPRLVYKNQDGPAESWDSMPRRQLAEMDSALAKRVIRLMFARAGLKQDIGAIHLNNLIAAIDKPDASIIEFAKGFKAERSGDRVYVKAPNVIATEKKKFEIKTCEVVSILDAPPLRSIGKNACALDAEKVMLLNTDLAVRSRMPKDKIRPIGLGGSKKLSDYMIDAKIPREERDGICLLAAGSDILWVEGMAVSELCKVDSKTELILLTEIQED